MPRPRNFERDAVVQAAAEAFWEKGYDATPLSDLEERTGLNRSSLYLAFGSKRKLLSEALDRYAAEVIEGLIGPLEASPGLEAAAAFFGRVRDVILEQGHRGRRGCLLINTVAELSRDDAAAEESGVDLRDRLERAFRHAVETETSSRELDDGSVRRRARLLMASTIGVWMCARVDVDDAAALCDDVATEIRSWGGPP